MENIEREYYDEFEIVAQLALPLVKKRRENKIDYPKDIQDFIFDEMLDNAIWSLDEIASGRYDESGIDDNYNFSKLEYGLYIFSNFMTKDIASAILPIIKDYNKNKLGMPGNMSFEMYCSIMNTIVFALEEISLDNIEKNKENKDYIDKVNVGLNLLGTHLTSMWN
jgi:hypothetical protein